jgi:hypothetical protein
VPRGTQDPRPPPSPFAYGILTLCDAAFQHASARFPRFLPGPTTPASPEGDPGLGSFPFARRYSGNRSLFLFLQVLRWFTSLSSLRRAYLIQLGMVPVSRTGFPHSDTPGSSLACSSPRLFAAGRVLLRLLAPRHPPYTLSSLTLKLFVTEKSQRPTCGLCFFALTYPNCQRTIP